MYVFFNKTKWGNAFLQQSINKSRQMYSSCSDGGEKRRHTHTHTHTHTTTCYYR